MLSHNINFKNFKLDNLNNKKIIKIFKSIIKSPNQVLCSLSSNYKDSYSKKFVSKMKRFNNFRLIGIGGSILGAQAIYNFLSPLGKKFQFIDSLSYVLNKKNKKNKKKQITLIVSKSGNTLETISNTNIFVKKNEQNIFITEKKKNYLRDLAIKLKAKIIDHNNYIGGRYSVLSEVGMLPASLMGFKPEKFRRLNHLIEDKTFVNKLISSVSSILHLSRSKNMNNSIIINYDQDSNEFFKWYQQLVAESLGKKSKGILPVISTMPQDNHSLMQHYLDGAKNNFYTLHFFKEKKSIRLNNNTILKSHNYLKDKNLNDILFSQFSATEKVFKKKKIPFRSFIIYKKNEETLGELFTFFILETILLGMAMEINPFDQPAVEIIKKETKKILI